MKEKEYGLSCIRLFALGSIFAGPVYFWLSRDSIIL